LSVGTSCSEEDVKKSYKKLAIKLHPDKNHAPKSADAFKKVSAAYACLVDKEKRKMYDLTGEEPGNNQSAGNNRGFRRRDFEQGVDPEEIFNMFFGGGGGDIFGQPTRQRQYRQR